MMMQATRRAISSAVKSRPDYTGTSGQLYSFKKLIQQRPETGSVWIASSGSTQYILKDIPTSYYLNFTEDIWPRLREHRHPNIRLPCDTIPGEKIFVYQYFAHDFLELCRTTVGLPLRRRILKAILQGLAEMHHHDLVHLDVKPDNMVVESSLVSDGSRTLQAVQVTDFENAVWLKPGKNVLGMLAGNENWRSPEAHLRSKLNKPTDMFSFGIICIYAVLGRIVLGRDKDFEYHVSQGIEPGLIRLQRQTCFFGDELGYKGLREHLSHDQTLCQLLDAMWEDRTAPYIPYKHFSTWPEVEDEEFRDLILKLTNLDPQRRITARHALEHPWFAGVEAV